MEEELRADAKGSLSSPAATLLKVEKGEKIEGNKIKSDWGKGW